MRGVIVLALLLVAGLLLQLFVGSHLYDLAFVGTGRAFARLLPSSVAEKKEAEYDYHQPNAWSAHPNTEDWADLLPPGQNNISLNAAVFYVYPSSYFGLQWNAPASSSSNSNEGGLLARFADLVADSTGMVHASIFNFGRVYIPRYRQMSAWGFMHENSALRDAAMEIALRDVERAYQVFLDENPSRPIILAAHSQGSMLVCKMLRRRMRESQRVGVVAAYLIAADLSDGDCGPRVRQCNASRETGCFVHFNAFLRQGGDRSKFVLDAFGDQGRKNLSCVNPLSFDSKQRVHVAAELNPGSRAFLRPRDVLSSMWRWMTATAGDDGGAARGLNLMSPLEPGLFGAECDEGVLWVDHAATAFPSGYFTTGVFPGLNLHGAESSLFYRALRDNAMERLAAHTQQGL